ncbi:MAG: class I SAM-dependent methyltransferase [Alphaproteobacteria bacterium]|nr:class I SAM-dependent methyltransferase [Alphaproteobacteria bacterium]
MRSIGKVQRAPKGVDYGGDAPSTVRGLFYGGAATMLLGGALSLLWTMPAGPGVLARIGAALGFATAAICLWPAIVLWRYSHYRKFVLRERSLDLVQWRGDERVLDIGTGRGLMAIGAAKRLSSGRVIGVDIWSTRDLSGNSVDAARHNAEIAGVSARIDFVTNDARSLPFGVDTFDILLSTLCFHNISTAFGRAVACRELARVLKPGGRAIIADIWHTKEYLHPFAAAGVAAGRSRPLIFTSFPSVRLVDVRKAH